MASDFDCVPHDKNGRHPEAPSMAFFEIESHYGSWILTSPAKPGTSALISTEDLVGLFESEDHDFLDEGFGYASDEILEILDSD